MCVDVDESGRDDQARGLDGLERAFSCQISYLDNRVTYDADVGLKRGIPRSINDPAISDEDVEIFGRVFRTPDKSEQSCNDED